MNGSVDTMQRGRPDTPCEARPSRSRHRTADACTPLMKPSARHSAVKVAVESTKPCTSGPSKVMPTAKAKGHNTEAKPRHGRSTSRPPQPRPSRSQQPSRSTSCSDIATASAMNAAPFACRLRSCKQPKEQKTLGTKTTKAPFRPPSRDPSPRLATSNYVTFREQHRKYYNSIRHTFIANASSTGSGGDRHARCKTSNATCQHSGRPPWDDSTKVSFAPESFKALIPVRRTTRKASVRLKKDDSAEDEASFADSSECENAAEPKGADPLLGFSFLFKPYSFSFLSPSKSTSKDKCSAEKDAPASVGKAGNEKKEQLPPKKDALASVGNIESASQDTKLGGSRRRHLASKENKPPVESRSSTKSNALSNQKEGADRVPPTRRAPVRSTERI
ncbi:uncharacterized protein LOC119177741 isoform X2 [Rhipicephalus microplus]|uniref:uncharacterized protein LOC119177741 isoform X2 n=1 Tax=Rhipicephalus microplus TaxID=6941 RepID=UPI003F6B5172